ncbi:MAG TPA: iron-sulfur cluster assembly scaffold protein [Bryobacteraceae bacterium]|nr:iron-sulfur cluster assembly scaffold protein [Bryobacteraceae bacterium]
MYSEILIDHFRNPRNVGELPSPPAIVASVENPACGDTMVLYARIADGRIAEVRYQVRGCTASIATASAFTELLLDRTRAGVKALNAADAETAVGGLPPESKHAAALCVQAAKLLLLGWE